MLGRSNKLAKTSQKPGKTLLINHFKVDNGDWYLVDLPGYGYAQRGMAQREKLAKLIERYIFEREQLTELFVLIDIRHEAQKIDLEFMNMLGENGIPFSIIFTKADKVGPVAAERNVEAYKKVLHKTWEELPRIFITSSEKGRGRDEILNHIYEINKEISRGEKAESTNGNTEQTPNSTNQ